MGAELGATTSIFPFDASMDRYLRATERAALADLAAKHVQLLTADAEVERDPSKYFARVIEIDLTTLEPHLVGPHSPDLARPISAVAAAVAKESYPDQISVALIGSCTNSSYEDIARVTDVVRQAKAHGMKATIPFLVTPGSEQIRATIVRDGQMGEIQSVGGQVLANACGPCIGQWKRDEIKPGTRNTIVTSYNRNFPARNDGSRETLAFMGSPEIVAAYALAGRLSFNPMKDTLQGGDGKPFTLTAPKPAPDLPANGFVRDLDGYVAPAADGSKVQLEVSHDSKRLQLLTPFAPWDGKDFVALPLLLKAKGTCTTDHISPAGPWLRYRGHLDNISDNMFTGAISAFTGQANPSIPKIARDFKAKGLRWIVVGDENYGEGSSREHAAMSPRFLGCAAVIVRSFARIHESNLKKQGILPLTFANPADYDKVKEHDRISILGLGMLAPGGELTAVLLHDDAGEDRLALRHTLNAEQIGWFKAGSALNVIKSQSR
jgi:aconitate hydratase